MVLRISISLNLQNIADFPVGSPEIALPLNIAGVGLRKTLPNPQRIDEVLESLGFQPPR